jgi:DNA-directed RNA polymerase specialized sigma24 family protein
MSSDGSVTHWISQLKAGQRAAAQPLWQRYFEKLVARARQKLRGIPRGAADEEDVALSAFDNFCRAAEQGRFPDLADRDDLWQILLMLTDRKALNLIRNARRQKRGGDKVLNEAACLDLTISDGPLSRIPDREPSPAFAALFADECQRLLGRLDNPNLQRTALLRMEAYTIEEIAAQLGRVPRTIERWLHLIRQIWGQELSA